MQPVPTAFPGAEPEKMPAPSILFPALQARAGSGAGSARSFGFGVSSSERPALPKCHDNDRDRSDSSPAWHTRSGQALDTRHVT